MELIDIIKDTGSDLETRIDAVDKLNENEIVIDDLDEDIQMFIVKHSDDQSLLGFFVINSEFEYIHFLAMEKIDDAELS